MIIAPRQVDATLAAPLAEGRKGMLLFGPDQGLVQMRIEAATAWFRSNGWAIKPVSRELLKDQPAYVLEELNNLSFFADKQVFFIRPAADALTRMVQEAWAHVSAESFLLLWGEELPKSSSLRQFFEKAPAGASIPCYEPDAAQVADMIRQAMQQRGKRIEPDALRFFAEQLGGELMVLAAEVEKLALYLGDAPAATLADVQAVVAINGEEAFSDFAYLALEGRGADTLASLQALLRGGESPVAMMRMMARLLERLLHLRLQVEEGKKPPAQAIQEARPPIFFKDAPFFQRAIGRWGAATLLRALQRTTQTERALKTTGCDVEAEMLGYTRALLLLPQRFPASLRSNPSSSARL